MSVDKLAKGSHVVVGVFKYLDDTITAVKHVRSKGVEFNVYSPCANHELEHAAYPQRSWVRAVTLSGALLGVTFGFALAILCALDWPLRVSAKDVVSIPGYVVIGYECMILFGAIFTLLGLLHFCRLPDILRKVGYDPRFSRDRFGIVVGCSKEQAHSLKSEMLKAGAEEAEIREGL